MCVATHQFLGFVYGDRHTFHANFRFLTRGKIMPVGCFNKLLHPFTKIVRQSNKNKSAQSFTSPRSGALIVLTTVSYSSQHFPSLTLPLYLPPFCLFALYGLPSVNISLCQHKPEKFEKYISANFLINEL